MVEPNEPRVVERATLREAKRAVREAFDAIRAAGGDPSFELRNRLRAAEAT